LRTRPRACVQTGRAQWLRPTYAVTVGFLNPKGRAGA
jgi:hypothetical protein